MRALDHCREAWREHQLNELRRAEHACHGLLDPNRRDEFRRLYGIDQVGLWRGLFRTPPPNRPTLRQRGAPPMVGRQRARDLRTVGLRRRFPAPVHRPGTKAVLT